MAKERGWCKRGERLFAEKSGNRKGKRITVIGALRHHFKLLAPVYFEGNTDTEGFNYWIKEHLLPEIAGQKKVIIMDNAAFHKSKTTRDLIEVAGHQILFLPPYSPDLNPIECKWFHVKNMVKNIKDRFKEFYDCLDFVLCYQ
jgi:transposase